LARHLGWTVVAVLLVLPPLSGSSQTNTPSAELAQEEKNACIRNLEVIYQAVTAFRNDHKDLPSWLSDLVPQYLPDVKVLTCPVCRRTGRTEERLLADPKMPSSYLWEFCPVPLGSTAPDAPNRTRREWKQRQQELIGPVVPIVRCRYHKQALNLGFDGKIYESPGQWELNFTNKVSLAALSAGVIFGNAAAPQEKPVPKHPTLKVPTRPSDAPKECLDLTPFYNALLRDSWHGGASNDLAGLPAGLHQFDGVRFDARGIVQLAAGKSSSPSFPPAVKGIPVGMKCKQLHFLHAAGWGANTEEGRQIGSYLIHFVGNPTRLEIPIQYGREMRNWHWLADEPPSPKELRVVWTGENGISRRSGRPLRLFLTTWTNLLPDFEIASVDFISNLGTAAPFLLAITAESP
jgi:hypothetical protein